MSENRRLTNLNALLEVLFIKLNVRKITLMAKKLNPKTVYEALEERDTVFQLHPLIMKPQNSLLWPLYSQLNALMNE